MDVSTQTVAPCEIEFTIHPEAQQLEEARRKAARQLSRRVRIPGFRPGKAPLMLVERTVGKEYFAEETAEVLGPELYKQLIEEGGYKPYDRPSLRISQQEPLEIKITVPLQPTAQLGDYCALRIEPEPEPVVTAEQEEQMLNELREQHGTWEPVTRAAQMADQVTVDLVGTTDGEQVVDQKDYSLVLSERLAPEGMAQALVGMEAGQERSFELTYPQNYGQPQLAGKHVAFKARLKDVKERRLPTLDDEFARSLGDFENLEAIRQRLRDGLKKRLDGEAKDRLQTRALDEVVKISTLEYPNAAVEEEINRLLRQRDERLRRQGFTLETFLRVTHRSIAQMRDELRSEAEENLKRSLVLREVARAEKIEVSDEEVAGEVERVAAAYGEQADQVRRLFAEDMGRLSVASDLFSRRTLERLVDIVTGRAEGACAPPEVEKGAEPPAEASEAQ